MALPIKWLINNVITAVRNINESSLLSYLSEKTVEASSSSASLCSSILEDFNKLEKRLKKVKNELHDVEKKEVLDEETVKNWLQDIQGLAYEADDILDEYLYEILQVRVMTKATAENITAKRKRVKEEEDELQVYDLTGASRSLAEVDFLENMNDRLKEVIEKFDEIVKDQDDFTLGVEDDEKWSDTTITRTRSTPFPDRSIVFGREKEKGMIIDFLLAENGQDQGNLSVIPIVGIGGIGKTTLAKMVYNDPAVRNHFNIRGWVCVSDDFNVLRLTKEIIRSMTGDSCVAEELGKAQNELRDKLRGRRFLLVLDDVWNENKSLWESLAYPLHDKGKGKIIVTTRIDQVAETMQTSPFIRLRNLSPENSWLLFQEQAFNKEENNQENLIEIGKKIVMKCNGLPLAVKVVGAALGRQLYEQEWVDVLESELWELPAINVDILPALKLSYSRMPTYLRPCFLYFSLYAKDSLLYKSTLVNLWMAQGYLQTDSIEKLEDIGNEYFDELLNRGIIDRVEDEVREEAFLMHDMIHDLARSISAEQFWTLKDESNQKECNNLNNVRHVHSRVEITFSTSQEMKFLRSYISLGSSSFSIITSLLNTAYLRALDLDLREDCEELPDSIGDLKHLRYLSLDCHGTKRLPDTICRLYHLQTLKISSTVLEQLPNDIGNLINLVSFSLDGHHKIKVLPESLFRLSGLRYLDLCCEELNELPARIGHLTTLQEFCLISDALVELPVSISDLVNLQKLELLCDSLVTLPVGLSKLTNLRHVNIDMTEISELQDFLLQLPSLCKIFFGSNACLPHGIDAMSSILKFSSFNVGRGPCAGLAELKNFDNLGPNLRINGLNNVRNVQDGRQASLHNKQKIFNLVLSWDDGICIHDDEETDDKCTDYVDNKILLENLKPHINIEKLEIEGYTGSEFPKWIGNPCFCNLFSIDLLNFSRCVNLTPLGQIPGLKNLSIQGFMNLTCLDRGSDNSSKVAFPALDNLTVSDMPELEKCFNDVLHGDFPVLLHVTFSQCPKLTKTPTLPNRFDKASVYYVIISECANLEDGVFSVQWTSSDQ